MPRITITIARDNEKYCVRSLEGKLTLLGLTFVISRSRTIDDIRINFQILLSIGKLRVYFYHHFPEKDIYILFIYHKILLILFKQ